MTRLLLTSLLLMTLSVASAVPPVVSIDRVPDEGLQPRLMTDGGDIHLLYFKPAEPGSRRGRYIYRQFDDENNDWGPGVHVSGEEQPLFDPIGRASMDVDEEGRVHVTWLVGGERPFAYARSNPSRDSFGSPAFPIDDNTTGIESGAALTVSGNTVTLVWHAGDMANESTRRVFAIVSADHGETWSDETPIDDSKLGVCACCALAATVADNGKLNVAYRSAVNNDGRHMQIMSSGNSQSISEWTLNTCPVSTNQFEGQWLTFETRGRIMNWHPELQPAVAEIASTDRDVRQKHPALAISSDGFRLTAWGEAAGYVKGGALNAVLTSPTQNVESIETGSAMMPDYSSVAATWTGERFLILY